MGAADGARAPRGAVPRRGLVDRRHPRHHGGDRAGGGGVGGVQRALQGAALARAPSPTSTSGPGGWPDGCRGAASVRATWSSSRCRTGWRPARRSGPPPTWAPSVVPIVHFYGAKEVEYILRTTEPEVIVTPDRFGYSDFLATYAGLLGDDPAATVAGGRRHARRRPARRAPSPSTSPRRRAAGRPAAGGPRRAVDRRVHVGHDARPEGRHPLAPHDRVRDPPARPHVPRGRAAADHRRARRPLHRDGERVPRARCSATGPSTSSTCGIPARSCG